MEKVIETFRIIIEEGTVSHKRIKYLKKHIDDVEQNVKDIIESLEEGDVDENTIEQMRVIVNPEEHIDEIVSTQIKVEEIDAKDSSLDESCRLKRAATVGGNTLDWKIINEIVEELKYHEKNIDTPNVTPIDTINKLMKCNSFEKEKVIKYLNWDTETCIEEIICKYDNFDVFECYLRNIKKCNWNVVMRYVVKYNKWKLFGNIILNYSKKNKCRPFKYGVIYSIIFRNKITCIDIHSYISEFEYSVFEEFVETCDYFKKLDLLTHIQRSDLDEYSLEWYSYFKMITGYDESPIFVDGELSYDTLPIEWKCYKVTMLDIYCRNDLDVIIDDHACWLRDNVDCIISNHCTYLFKACFDRHICDRHDFNYYDILLCEFDEYDNISTEYTLKLCEILNSFQKTYEDKMNTVLSLIHTIKFECEDVSDFYIFFMVLAQLLRKIIITHDIMESLHGIGVCEFIEKNTKKPVLSTADAVEQLLKLNN